MRPRIPPKQMGAQTGASNPNLPLPSQRPGNVFPGLDKMSYMMHGAPMNPFSIYEAALARAGYMADLKTMGATHFVPTVRP